MNVNQYGPSPWTDDRVATLRELWAEGQSARQISLQLKCTRSAVCGKVFRLQLERRVQATTAYMRVRELLSDRPAPQPYRPGVDPKPDWLRTGFARA